MKYKLLFLVDVSDNVFDLSHPVLFNDGIFYEEDRFEPMEEATEITEAGAELFEQWQEDDSCGYDLCNGQAKGLARKYSKYEIYEHIKTNYKA